MKYITTLIISFSVLISSSQEISENVYFDVDEFELTPKAKNTLDEFIPSNQNKEIEITGYTDSTGSVAYNLELSKKRAQSVADYLLLKGMSIKNLKPLQSKGETTSSSTLSENRKVTIIAFAENVVEPKKEDKPSTQVEHLSKTSDGEINQEKMDNIAVGDILNVGGLEFHPGRHFLKAYSMSILDKLTKVLMENPDVKIEIQGHICCQPSGDGLDTDTGTRNLSENRAEMVYIELIKRGITKDRLSFKGYGSSRKLEDEINPQAMQRNRRVSILIIEK